MEQKEKMSSSVRRSEEERRGVQLATEGSGPLLQRDYVVVIEGSPCTPKSVMERIRRDFPSFSPVELAEFTRPANAPALLGVGDTMHIHIRGYGECAVRISQVDECSLTLRTLDGHLESGRITFSARRDEGGRLVVRIRSRARLRNAPWHAGYRLVGKQVQTRTWITFLERVAAACGGRILGKVLTSTDQVRESPADRGEAETPTTREDGEQASASALDTAARR